MEKTNKAFAKRIKITGSGRVLKRNPGQNHFRARKSRAFKLDTKRSSGFSISKKELGKYLPYA
ncbi:MAG: 50S ribosomal protein L35 [Candidatus Niyogibacteria bacterium]|nr:MAG: 50S ribosomal protein L35 [Candidatus Niyogibacteria bacterium]